MTTLTFAPPTELESVQDVPAAALQMAVGRFEFAESDEGETFPVTLTARSDQPIVHWYWGRIVHDMTGFSTHKARVPIDYCHNYDEIMGFLESSSFTHKDGGLQAAGELVPFAGDRVSEVRHKAKLGVPYEASLNFNDEMKLEWIDAGQKADVNGFEFEGPGVIVREWGIRGVAICPYGADKNTSAEFSKNDGGTVPVSIFKGDVMTKETPKKPAEQDVEPDNTELSQQETETPSEATPEAAAELAEAPAAEGADDPRAEAKRFAAAFGAENGVAWFAEGKTFAEGLELHAEAQREEIKALKAENEKLKELQASIQTGEEEPVSFSGDRTGSDTEEESKFSNACGDGLAAFAASQEARFKSADLN